MVIVTKKKSSMDRWFLAPREEIAKRTTHFAKGYLAHKAEDYRSPFAHHEMMEEAELRAEQAKEAQNKDTDNGSSQDQ